MPPTADEMVAAARINFGKARDDRGMELRRRWLDTGCRDWRRESGDGIAADEVVVSAVFAMPLKAQLLRIQIANNVRRWRFMRKEHAKTSLRFLTIEEYMQNPTGDLVRNRVRALLQGAVQKHTERMDFIDRVRRQRREEKAAKLRETQIKNSAPELRLILKGLWTNVAMNSGPRREAKGWQSFRDAPVKKRRRLARGIEYEEIDNYDKEGEPIWARINVRR